MLKNITIGKYIMRHSPVHDMDPRMKIIVTMMLVVGLFFVDTFWGFMGSGIFALIVVFLARLSVVMLLKGLRPVIFILAFTVIIHLLFTKGGTVLVSWRFLQIEQAGLYTGLFMATRIILLISFTSLLTLTTSPIQLTDGLEHLLNPFKRIGVPAHELAMMMTIALRFIPTLLEEAEKIMKAQKARGADFESGNILRRARSLVPLLVPLFLSAFRRADDLAMAMEARCYRGGEGRTRMKELTLRRNDWLALVYSLAIILLISLL